MATFKLERRVPGANATLTLSGKNSTEVTLTGMTKPELRKIGWMFFRAGLGLGYKEDV